MEFFQRLPADLANAQLFRLAVQYVQADAAGRTTDIEQILWVLEELRQFLRDIGDTKTVPGWFLHQNRLGYSIDANLDYKQLFDAKPQVTGRIDRLIDDIYRLVYELYGRTPQMGELESNWLPLLRSLLKASERLDIFTTNYDTTLEVALDILQQETQLPQIDTGHRGSVRRYLDSSVWSAPPTTLGVRRTAGLLTKLHGSIDWSRGGDQIYISDPLFKGTHERHVIVYPGFKGVPTTEPFVSFHAHFAKAVAAATELIFIGFAFRDQYINDLLQRLLPTGARVIVIDPATIVANAVPEAQMKRIADVFGPASVATVLEQLAIS